jgi:hypothetical protein
MKRWEIADPVRFVTLCMATAPALTAIPALIYSGAAAALNWSKWPEAAPPAVEWAGRLLGTGAGALIFLPLAMPLGVIVGFIPGFIACFLNRILAEWRPVRTVEAVVLGVVSSAPFGLFFEVSPSFRGATLFLAWCGAWAALIAIWVGEKRGIVRVAAAAAE